MAFLKFSASELGSIRDSAPLRASPQCVQPGRQRTFQPFFVTLRRGRDLTGGWQELRCGRNERSCRHESRGNPRGNAPRSARFRFADKTWSWGSRRKPARPSGLRVTPARWNGSLGRKPMFGASFEAVAPYTVSSDIEAKLVVGRNIASRE